MAWFRVDKEGGEPLLSARECAAAAVWRGKILISNGNDAHTRYKDLIEFDPRGLSAEKFPAAQNSGQTPVSAHTFCGGPLCCASGSRVAASAPRVRRHVAN